MSSAHLYSFGTFELDPGRRRLTHAGQAVSLPDRHLGVLVELVSRPGDVLTKNALVEAVWRDVAVTDNSLEQAVSALRRALGAAEDGQPYIETVPRQGYRFTGVVTKTVTRATDEALDALLAPQRAWLEGRSALETLEGDQVVRARTVFERVLAGAPDHAPAHVGLANACVMQFEMTRADQSPDRAALALAAHHAREACRLDSSYGEAWATLGFVLARTGSADALAASRRAVVLEPDNWRHHCRLAYVGWGEERMRAGRRVLTLLPSFPLAHWLVATVHVARGALADAERELSAAIANQPDPASGLRFSAVALHWLRGLIHLARGDARSARADFARELANEASGHLYARECCANAWYAIGALELREGQDADADAAFRQALRCIATHPLASIAIARTSAGDPGRAGVLTVDVAIARGVGLVLEGSDEEAASLIDAALAEAPEGSAGWLLPVEPLLHVSARPQVWQQALTRLRGRAA